MRSNYKKLGGYIRQVDKRNSDARLGEDNLYGISVTKEFIVSHANLVGVTFDSYKVVSSRQFAYIPDTSRRGDKIAISLNTFGEDIIVSSICSVFEIVDESKLLPEYLMLWFMRPEFDRYARFMSNGSAREVFDWDCMCGVELPVPPISEQRKFVHNYQVITDRIELLKKMNENLVSQCDAIYRSLTAGQDANGKLADIATVNSGKRPESITSGIIPLLGAGGIMDYISDFNYDIPSLIIGRVGTHGVVQRGVKFWASDNTLVIVPKYFEFVFHVLREIDYAVLNRGSTQPLITQGDIKALDIYIPKKEELVLFEYNASKIMSCYSEYQKEIETLKRVSMLAVSHMR